MFPLTLGPRVYDPAGPVPKDDSADLLARVAAELACMENELGRRNLEMSSAMARMGLGRPFVPPQKYPRIVGV